MRLDEMEVATRQELIDRVKKAAEILDVDVNSNTFTPELIRQKRRQIASQYHPDVSLSDNARMYDVNDAVSTLSNFYQYKQNHNIDELDFSKDDFSYVTNNNSYVANNDSYEPNDNVFHNYVSMSYDEMENATKADLIAAIGAAAQILEIDVNSKDFNSDFINEKSEQLLARYFNSTIPGDLLKLNAVREATKTLNNFYDYKMDHNISYINFSGSDFDYGNTTIHDIDLVNEENNKKDSKEDLEALKEFMKDGEDGNYFIDEGDIKIPRPKYDPKLSEIEIVEFLKNYYEKAFKYYNALKNQKENNKNQSTIVDEINKKATELANIQDQYNNVMKKIQNSGLNDLDKLQVLLQELKELAERLSKLKQEIAELRKQYEKNKTKALPGHGYQPSLPEHIEREKEIEDEPKIEVPEEKQEKHYKHTLEEILYMLAPKDEQLTKKDAKKYNISNIKFSQNFKNATHQGNWIYNLVGGAKAIVFSIPTKIIKTLKSREMGDAVLKANHIKERFAELSEEDKETIFNEFLGFEVLKRRDIALLNTVIVEEMSKWVQKKIDENNKRIREINTTIIQDFKQILQLEKEIENLDDPKLIAEKSAQIDALISGKADLIKEIRTLQKEGTKKYGAGLANMQQGVKAYKTKLSIQGKRFSKTFDTDHELLEMESDLSRELEHAIVDHDDKTALATYLQTIKGLSDNTIIKNSIFGKRSVGHRYYNPEVQQVNYNDDTLVRDLLSVVATVGSVCNVVGNVMQMVERQNAIAMHNQEIANHNQDLQNYGDKVHNYGQQLDSDVEKFAKGDQAMGADFNLAGINQQERDNLDINNWIMGDQYHVLDHAAHKQADKSTSFVEQTMSQIAQQYQSGKISAKQAFEQSQQFAQTTYADYISSLTQSLDIIKTYARNNPSIDVASYQQAVEQVINSSSDINGMLQAQSSVVDVAEQLINLQGVQAANKMSELNENIIPTIVGAGTAFALATQSYQKMLENAKNGKYGESLKLQLEGISSEDINDFYERANVR